MRPVELVNETINLNHTDRIPVDLHNFTVAAEGLGRSYSEIFHSGELMARSQIEQWEKFGHDTLLLENGTAAVAETLGCEVVYPDDNPPRLTGPAISDLDEVSSLPHPDPTVDGTLPELLKATSLVKDELDDQFVMGRGDQGPFSLASMVLGMERFLMEMSKRENLGAIEELLNHCREVIETYIRAQMEAGADGSSIGDSIAGPDVCNPDFYREFALPQEKRLFEGLNKDYNRPISLHICGDATNIVPEMIDSGAEILELDYKIDQEKVRGLVEDEVAFLGPLDPVLLGSGSPERVYKRTEELLSLWGSHGGLIFGPGCAMNAGTPEENVKSMIKAVRDHTPENEEGDE
ncbi:MAG: uroporphyrinogen decarboxylase family protein [Candidatus Bipolaricaulota bacterium]